MRWREEDTNFQRGAGRWDWEEFSEKFLAVSASLRRPSEAKSSNCSLSLEARTEERRGQELPLERVRCEQREVESED